MPVAPHGGPKQKSQQRSGKLSNGRPPTARRSTASLSKQATHSLIRSHHQLRKRLTDAQSNGNDREEAQLQRQIDDLGGLQSYQLASIQGQSNERGGDSSKILLDWLEDLKSDLSLLPSKMKMLEVGALSTKNACSKSDLFEVERIDLHSQGPGILQQDFMQRPLPANDSERFGLISLSLVLNFVPSPVGRGEMLRRACQFLDTTTKDQRSRSLRETFPALFLVLPAACILNSRYMTQKRLSDIMASLGYEMIRTKQTSKLIYFLWTYRGSSIAKARVFSKTQVNPGKNRNNFSIVLEV